MVLFNQGTLYAKPSEGAKLFQSLPKIVFPGFGEFLPTVSDAGFEFLLLVLHSPQG